MGYELDCISPLEDFHESTFDYPTTDIPKTRRARKISLQCNKAYNGTEKEKGVLIIWLLEWSDDFEPNAVKKNKGSMWIKTITICPPKADLHTMSRTFPLAIVLKKHHHEAAERKFDVELASLAKESDANYMYSKKWTKRVAVYVAMLASLMDQPEHCGDFGTALGGSTFHGRWLWARNIERCWKYLLPCSICMEFLLDPKFTGGMITVQCSNCTCFSYDPPVRNDEKSCGFGTCPVCYW
jgi:hypothetical protein